jgi:hypothetical protein
MSGIYKQKWQGSAIPEVKSGKATFECAGELLELHLDNFTDFMNICSMLDAVIEQSHYETKKNIKDKFDRIVK